ncbi:MAG: thiamine-phosphate kinase [Bacteroidetes bacterium]|jgi:thiamine-monophosphate kinase|nr:thiamine-phosphate kinase [Bacteroidota bacterium]
MSEDTKITNIGEFGLINSLTEGLVLQHTSTVKGVGDDAAVLKFDNQFVVVTTDMLTEGIHFNLMYTPLKHLGYKAVISNLSDIYAMNGTATQIVVSMAISKKFTNEWIEELYSGIRLACEKYKVDLVGGDITSSLTGLNLSITALGTVDDKKITYRSGAGENDLICVSGDLGAAYMGLQLLEREKKVFQDNPDVQPDMEGHDYVLERQLKPEARKDIVEKLSELNILPTSMIDISDGLSSEILHICNQSGLGCKIYADKIPIDGETGLMAQEFNMEPIVAALHGGEDYELLFTAKISDFDTLSQQEGIHIIGYMAAKDEGYYLIPGQGSPIELKAQGWDGFREEEA